MPMASSAVEVSSTYRVETNKWRRGGLKCKLHYALCIKPHRVERVLQPYTQNLPLTPYSPLPTYPTPYNKCYMAARHPVARGLRGELESWPKLYVRQCRWRLRKNQACLMVIAEFWIAYSGGAT